MAAGKKSAYLRDALVEHALGINAFTMPTNVFLALFTSDPTVDDTGDELTGGSYARQQLSFAAAVDGVCDSNTSETFTNLTANRITHWGIYDASTSGNLLYFGAFDIFIDVNNTDDLPIASGDISISEV